MTFLIPVVSRPCIVPGMFLFAEVLRRADILIFSDPPTKTASSSLTTHPICATLIRQCKQRGSAVRTFKIIRRSLHYLLIMVGRWCCYHRSIFFITRWTFRIHMHLIIDHYLATIRTNMSMQSNHTIPKTSTPKRFTENAAVREVVLLFLLRYHSVVLVFHVPFLEYIEHE